VQRCKNYKILEELNDNNNNTIDFIDKNNNNLLFDNKIIADIEIIGKKFMIGIIFISKNNLKYNIYVIKRTDSKCGWALNLKIRCINDLDNIIFDINIRNSDENEKIFMIE
jgi:hypothetical protein